MAGDASTQEQSTPIVPVARFKRKPKSAERHEERGVGWRARWLEGAESLSLEREPSKGRRQRRFRPRVG